jgi:hypothetical protein
MPFAGAALEWHWARAPPPAKVLRRVSAMAAAIGGAAFRAALKGANGKAAVSLRPPPLLFIEG